MDYTDEKCLNCKRIEEEKMDILFKVMDNENDVTLTDQNGIILKVSDSYERHYYVSKHEVIGKSVFEMEAQGVFNPSVTALVLKGKRKVTIMQQNKHGQRILTTGVPIFKEDGELQYVISFNSIDIAEMTTMQQQYSKLNELMKEYNSEINKLRLRDIKDKELIAKSKYMENINELVSQIADTNANVMITGETGVGKTMIAKVIHKSSTRAEGPFIEINCGTIPESLIESELFGYEKGAFTGANSKGKIGKIELAKGGTLFLDEIGEMSLNMQIKFLDVIQDKVITRIGGLDRIDVDFRLIVATNRDLKKDMENGNFREDLFYRLNVVPIHIPPLREREEDILPLIAVFLKKLNDQYKRKVELSADVYKILQKQKWPGNIRQVENLVERLVITAKENMVEPQDLPPDIKVDNPRINNCSMNIGEDSSLEEMMDEYEKMIIIDSYNKYKTSIAVGKALGISQATAARRLRKYIPNYAD